MNGGWTLCAFMFGVKPSRSSNPSQRIAKHCLCCCMVSCACLCVILCSSVMSSLMMYCMPVMEHKCIRKSCQAKQICYMLHPGHCLSRTGWVLEGMQCRRPALASPTCGMSTLESTSCNATGRFSVITIWYTPHPYPLHHLTLHL